MKKSIAEKQNRIEATYYKNDSRMSRIGLVFRDNCRIDYFRCIQGNHQTTIIKVFEGKAVKHEYHILQSGLRYTDCEGEMRFVPAKNGNLYD